MSIERWLSKPRLLLGLTVVVFAIAWNRALAPLYAMFAVLAATAIVAFLAPRLALRGVRAERAHPAVAFEGDELLMTARLHNSAFGARRMLELVDRVPVAAPGQQNPMVFIARLPGRSVRALTFRLECYKRGAYRLGPITLRSGHPLGLAYRQKTIPGTVSELLVYPRVFPISHLSLPGTGGTPLRGAEAVSLGGGHEEFFGTREYRPGDSPRYVHWPSTARHGELIVKEFELRSATELTIVLDLDARANAGEGRDSTLEYAVKIAASAAQYALERGHEVQLVAYGQQPFVVPTGAGEAQLARLLETLARVEADGTQSYAQTIQHAAAHMRDGSGALLLFADPESNGAAAIEALGWLRAQHVRPICVFLNHRSFTTDQVAPALTRLPLVLGAQSEGWPVYQVARGDDLRAVFARP
jgi:uncharacterized protein (DUF58 family)